VADAVAVVPLGLWFAAAAAVLLVAAAVAGWVRSTVPEEARRPVLAVLTGWLILDIALGSVGLFAANSHRLIPGIAAGIVLPLLVGAWLLRPEGSFGRVLAAAPLHSLVGLQVYRIAGAVFILAWADGRMPGAFALPAGLGDIAVGLSAPLVAARLRRGPAQSLSTAALWNRVGIADLLLAVTLGALSSPTPFHPDALGKPNPLISRLPFVLIPVFAVPLSFLLHLLTLRRISEQ
jgi:hypothetical protein